MKKRANKILEKLLRVIKDNRWIFITFGIASIIVMIIYTLKAIKPFGNNSMLDIDFYHQYGPLLNELYDRVKSGESLLYSFNTGGGIPFYRNFLNYLSSPFNIIMFLFKKENIVMSFSIIIGLKVIFAATTMSYYLKKTFKKDNVMLCVFSCLYAFSGYFCAYYWNIMWLDGIVFLPLVAHGINKLVNEKKPCFYTISLSIMLFANYFIAYMVCIFSVLYFLGLFIYKSNFKLKNIIENFLMFFIFSLLAAGLVSFALLPLYDSLASISATSDSYPSLSYSFNILDFFFNHITGTTKTVFASDILPLPNIYPGIISLVLIIAFLINKEINIRAKYLALLAIFIFVISFNTTIIDFMWHAFHVPNDLPYRYSFLYVFILIVIGYYSSLKIKSLSNLKVSICFMIMIVFSLLASKLSFENLSDENVIVAIILLLSYYLIYNLNNFKKIPRKVIYFLLIAITSIECIYSINVNWQIDHDIDTFMSDKPKYQKLINNTIKDDNDLYRIEKTDYLTLNDGAWYDYKGITTFTSMAYENVAKFQRKFGLGGNDINSYYYKNYATPVYNTIFNVKYIMGDYIDNDYYTLVDILDDINLMGYNYSSSLVYMVNKNIKNLSLESYMPFLNQNNFVSLATLNNDVYKPLKVENVIGGTIFEENFTHDSNGEFNYSIDSNKLTFELNNTEKQNIYLYVGGSNVTGYYVDGKYYSINSDEYYIVDAGKKDKGLINVEIEFEDTTDGYIKFYAYTLDDKVFKSFYEEIKNGMLNVKKYSDNIIIGDINAQKDELAFTTIPYDKGWNVYVDGTKVKTYEIADSYLAFDVEEGNHEIKMVFYPEKLKTGIIISFISLIILATYLFVFEKKESKNNKKDEFNV